MITPFFDFLKMVGYNFTHVYGDYWSNVFSAIGLIARVLIWTLVAILVIGFFLIPVSFVHPAAAGLSFPVFCAIAWLMHKEHEDSIKSRARGAKILSRKTDY